MLIVLAVTMVAAARTEPPAEPPAPPAERVPAQPARPDVVPLQALMQSMVRFVHVAPNVELERLVLVHTIDGFAYEAIHDLVYLDVSEDVPVPEGKHEVVLVVAGLERDERRADEVGAASGIRRRPARHDPPAAAPA